MSQSFKDPSAAPEHSNVEDFSGWKAQVQTPLVWPTRLASKSPVGMFHKRTNLSQDDVAKTEPSLEKDVPRTQVLWPSLSFLTSPPLVPFHRETMPSVVPEARSPKWVSLVPPGHHATLVTGVVCDNVKVDSRLVRSHIRTTLSHPPDARCSPPGLNSRQDISHLCPLNFVCSRVVMLMSVYSYAAANNSIFRVDLEFWAAWKKTTRTLISLRLWRYVNLLFLSTREGTLQTPTVPSHWLA